MTRYPLTRPGARQGRDGPLEAVDEAPRSSGGRQRPPAQRLRREIEPARGHVRRPRRTGPCSARRRTSRPQSNSRSIQGPCWDLELTLNCSEDVKFSFERYKGPFYVAA